MKSNRFSQLRDSFESLLDLPEDQREAALGQMEPGLAYAVRQMLAADAHTIGALDSRPFLEVCAPEGYELHECVGAGGMGEVYRATRSKDGFTQQVAIKYLRLDPRNTEVLRRFREERAILARMNHPAIVRFIDGGSLDNQHYIVTEFVQGQPITEYVAESGVRRCIELTITVCEALHHAHQHLVVHRDIKPSNVLVDEQGCIRLLDFGIAKILDTKSPSDASTKVLTPDYASPEQLSGQPITTATDVYGIGVLLYEMLTGRRPHNTAGLPPADLIDTVCHTRPLDPSSVVQRNRQSDISADLDLIIQKALHRDPAQRYATPAQLAEDLERYLVGAPVLAHADSWRYRASRFIARHRVPCAAAALIASVVAIAGVNASHQHQKTRAALEVAQSEREQARAISDYMVGLFDLADPTGTRAESMTVRELVQRGAKDLLATPTYTERPRMALALAQVLVHLGDYDTALRLIPAPRESQWAGLAALVEAEALRHQSKTEQARNVIDTALPAEDNPQTRLRMLLERAMLERAEGRYGRFLSSLQELLPEFVEQFGKQAVETGQITLQIGVGHWLSGNMSDAETHYLAALDIYRHALPARHPYLASVLGGLSILRHREGDYVPAAEFGEEALQIQLDSLGDTHPAVAATAANLGALHLDAQQFDRAKEYLERALSIQEQMPSSMALTNTLNSFGLLALRTEDFVSAESWFARATRQFQSLQPNQDHAQLAAFFDNRGLSILRQGDPERAQPWVIKGLEMRLSTLGDDHPNLAFSYLHLAEITNVRGDALKARDLAQEAHQIRKRHLGSDHELTMTALEILAEIQGTSSTSESGKAGT